MRIVSGDADVKMTSCLPSRPDALTISNEAPMTKPFALDPRDRELFRQSVGPVKPLRCDRIDPIPSHPAPIPRFTRADERRVLDDMLSDYFEPAELDTGEELYYRAEGVQQAVLRKLRRGQFRVGAALDLHGMTVAMAREALAGFLRAARRESLGCVRIVHGKGNGVLRNAVRKKLKEYNVDMDIWHPEQQQGGDGVTLVEIK